MRHIVVTAKTQIIPFIQKNWITGMVVLVAGGFLGNTLWKAYQSLPSEAQIAATAEANKIFFQNLGNAAADFSDFQKLCRESGGNNTFKPRGNALSIPGTSCSDLTPQGELKMRELFPGATPPSGM